MIAALVCSIQPFRRARRFADLSPHREEDHDRGGDPDRGYEHEDGVGDRLLVAVGAGLRDRCGRADREQEVLGVRP
jgi:hypothetical protein